MIENNTVDAMILRIAGGDTAALEELYNSICREVFAYAMSIVKDKCIAEDIMQDTFVRVFRGSKSFTPNNTGKAWVMRIVRNLSLNAVTRGSRYSGGAEPDIDASSVLSTEDTAIINISLNIALKKLSDSERQIIVLHAVSGFTLAEISEVTGEPLGTVKWRHASALKKIRSALND